MIEVAVSDQDTIKAFETNSGLKDLTLGTFTTIHQKPVFVVFNNNCRQITPD